MTSDERLDYPFAEVAAQLEVLVKDDPTLLFFQKYTCSGCGNRLTMDVPNRLYTEGSCDNCPAITNILATGCNYMLVLTVQP